MQGKRLWGARGAGALLAAVLVASATAWAGQAQAAHVANWAQDGYGAGNTGYNPNEPIINAGTIKNLSRRWSVTPGPGTEGCAGEPVAPLVVGDRVFVIDSTGVGAYDAMTGDRLWLYTAGYLEATGLAVVGDTVLVTDVNCFSNSNYSSNVVALNAATGEERWSELTSWSTRTFVADAGVFLVSGYCGVCDDAEYNVDAFRISDGTKLWSRGNAELAGPVSANGRVVLSSTTRVRSSVVSIRSGATRWSVNKRVTAHAANPAGDRFYLSDSAGLMAVSASSGRTVWRVRNAGGPLSADGRRVYVASGEKIKAYNAKTGRKVWTRTLSEPKRPVRAGGLLYTVTADDVLTILSPSTGNVIHAGGDFVDVTTHAVAAGGALYLTQGTRVRAYAP